MTNPLRIWTFIVFLTPSIVWANPVGVKITDKNGAPLADVAVVLPGGQAVDPGVSANHMRYVMDQVDKQFSPQFLLVPVNASVEFPNNDDTRHHVYSFSDAKTFELRLYHANEADPVIFETAGLVKIGCNIHDNMRAYIMVTPHTVFGMSDNSGIFQWPTLQQAPKTIELWHPQLEETFIVDVDQNAEEFVSVSLPFVLLTTTSKPETSSLEDRLKRFKRNAQ